MIGSMVAASNGRTREVFLTAQTAPGIAMGTRSHNSTGNNSSQRLNGVQPMSEVSPMRETRGKAQNAAMAKPQIQMSADRAAPFFHPNTINEATTTTIVVSTWERAVSAKASAAHLMYLSSSRIALTSSPRYTRDRANDHE